MANSQDPSGSGLTQGMSFCTVQEAHHNQRGDGQHGIGTDEWIEWTEETIQANFEVIEAIRAQDSATSRSFPGLARHDLAFATWVHFSDPLRGMAYAVEADCPWRALGLDPATAATSMAELLDDRAARLNRMLDEADHYWGRRGHREQNVADLRAKAHKWYE